MLRIGFFPVLWLLVTVSANASIDEVSCQADSFFECGRQIGAKKAEVVREAVTKFSALAQFARSADGKGVFEKLRRANTERYPYIAEECAGLAAGAGVADEEVLVAMLANELSNFAPPSIGYRPKSCSDFHILGSDVRAWGHNEDEAPFWSNHTYIVHANVTNKADGISSVYTGFAYAPNVVGWAWGFNQHGHAQSINALYPLLAAKNATAGLAVNFIARDVLEAASLDDAVRRASVPGQATGQHFNMGNRQTPNEQVMVECSPAGANVRRLHAKHTRDVVVAYHANLYESDKFSGIDGGASFQPSSAVRMSTMLNLAKALLPPRATQSPSLEFIGGVLSDHSDRTWPIHRDAQAPDCCLTLASVLFDVGKGRVHLFGSTSPVAAGGKPVRTYDWGVPPGATV